MLQRPDVVLVEVHGLFVARFLLLHLLTKTLGLVLGVVKLGKAIGDLASADEKFEAVNRRGVFVVTPGERRHLGGIGGDEGRVLEFLFHRLLENFELELADAVTGFNLDTQSTGIGRQLLHRVPVRASELRIMALYGLLQGQALEALAEVVLLALVGHGWAAKDMFRQTPQHLLGQVHQVVIIRIGLIKLEHGEFGIVPGRKPLVTEVAVDLIHPLKSADDQAFEIQLGSNAQKHFDIERMMVRHERARNGTAGNCLHHWSFNFKKLSYIHEFTYITYYI